ncbi:LytR/AlgR family response regulator transcription factor [Hymenobacter swuensis]|uniref:Uncharacterized protein n=1 Tax=Hymenobacter swuensis DY53 TaxID=1227739 RepID=W8EVN4_9BACT|nr:LytTR family DNA-binding domain-containing protein [Hymenobacter swuensis]AHJ95787.1 hypothetical protein Hsw_0192 [Hymenobacter swuensis DY53]
MSNPLACVIIDDEPLAQDLILKYAGRLGFLEVVAVFDNAIEALGKVEELRPDLIFLDVNMPEMNGIEFLKTFNEFKPAVILTTAYSEYAIQGFEYDVVDFILKPITFDRFVKAVNKVREKVRLKTPVPAAPSRPELPPANEPELTDKRRMLLIKENKRFLKVALAEVFFIEGMKDYLKIHTTGKVITTHMTMTKMEEMLHETDFLRVNRSYIVQKSAIKAINGNVIEMANNTEIPIGISYREMIKKMTDSGVL